MGDATGESEDGVGTESDIDTIFIAAGGNLPVGRRERATKAESLVAGEGGHSTAAYILGGEGESLGRAGDLSGRAAELQSIYLFGREGDKPVRVAGGFERVGLVGVFGSDPVGGAGGVAYTHFIKRAIKVPIMCDRLRANCQSTTNNICI